MFKIHKRKYDGMYEVLGYTQDPTADDFREVFTSNGQPVPEYLDHCRWVCIGVFNGYQAAQRYVEKLAKEYQNDVQLVPGQ